jgi:hypothetical protein
MDTTKLPKMGKEYNIFKCETCKDGKNYEFEEMRTHLIKVHKIDVTKTKAESTVNMHLDGADYFAWVYNIKIGNVQLTNESCQKRSKEDKKYWK